MTVAIAILNWNGKTWLEQFLPSVVKYSPEASIYVIDNASTDDSILFLKQNFPTVNIIRNQQNYGFAGGYNEGLKSVKEDIYCLLNSDVEVTENWITPILDLLKKDPSIAAVQPKILSYHNKTHFEFAGAAGGLIDNLCYPYCRGRVFDKIEEDFGQYDDETEIFWASGCAMFIRAEDFWQMQGFDARFFAHQEEIDLCWRLINAGRKVYYTYKSKVYHVGGGTLNKQSPQKTYLNFRNNLSMMAKNATASYIITTLFFRLCLDGIAGVKLMFSDGFAHTWAIVRAHFAFYGQLPKTLKLRKAPFKKNFYQSKWLIFKHFLGTNKS